MDTHGTVNLTIRDVWISGDFCPSGNVSLIPPAAHTGSVYIGGVYQGKNNTSIGTSSLPYASVDIVGGCTVQGSPQICSDSANSGVWSDGPPSVDPSDFELPAIDAPATYASANWNSPVCSTGSFTFDSDTTANGTTPTKSLMPSGASFDCTVKNSGGTPVGHLAWNNATQQLSISGTIWIDGNLNVSNSGTYVKDNVVPGANGATIYVNGTVSGASNITICGPIGSATPSGYGCPGTWDPNLGILALVVVNPTQRGYRLRPERERRARSGDPRQPGLREYRRNDRDGAGHGGHGHHGRKRRQRRPVGSADRVPLDQRHPGDLGRKARILGPDAVSQRPELNDRSSLQRQPEA